MNLGPTEYSRKEDVVWWQEFKFCPTCGEPLKSGLHLSKITWHSYHCVVCACTYYGDCWNEILKRTVCDTLKGKYEQ